MQEEHVNACVEYNQLKHQTSTNPHHFRNQITELITQSKNYDFDSVTKNWFQITDEQLSKMNKHQIHTWLQKMIQTEKNIETHRSLFLIFKQLERTPTTTSLSQTQATHNLTNI